MFSWVGMESPPRQLALVLRRTDTCMMPPGGVRPIGRRPIHPSTWKVNSANFALTEFAEVREGTVQPYYQRYQFEERYHTHPHERDVASRLVCPCRSQERREGYHREEQLEERQRNQGQYERGYPHPGVLYPSLGRANSLSKHRGCRTLFTEGLEGAFSDVLVVCEGW